MTSVRTRRHALILPTGVARHPRSGTQWYRLLLRAAYGLPTAHALLCTVNGDESAVFRFFVPVDLDLWPLTMTFELGRAFSTMYLIAKFDSPMFTRSEVILRTSKLTDRRRWKHPPRSAMLRRWIKMSLCRY